MRRCVVPGRLELPTSTLSVWRSNQLSYRTVCKVHAPLQPSLLLSTDKRAYKRKAQEGNFLLHLSSLFLFVAVSEGHIYYMVSIVSIVSIVTNVSNDSSDETGPCPRCSRKEVFQPHLPVRLPCYDLAPITSFTLGRPSRSRTSGAPGFHGLTGGVYKARERIHRAMADARLLANPASWGRVADPNPN